MSWTELREVVATRVLDDAERISNELRALGIAHALVGGLAVGLHGHPRATKDVDFIVGADAFATTAPLLSFREELAPLVQWGKIDLIAALPEDPALAAELQPAAPGAIPVIGIEALILMKLRASRPQDIADVAALVRAGADVASTLDYLRRFGAEHVAPFSTIAARAIG